MKLLLFDLGSKREEFNEPLGIEILHSCLSQFCCDLEINTGWYHINGFPNESQIRDYDILAFSVSSGALERLEKVLLSVDKNKKTLIILGGIIPTFAYNSILEKYPNAICVRGEGETAIIELIKLYLKENRLCEEQLINIPNLALMLHGKLMLTHREVEDLSNIPIPSRLFSDFISEVKGITRIEASRGCSWSRCSFCCIKEKYGTNKWRPFPIEHITQQLIELGKHGMLNPYFTDEDFFGNNYSRAIKLACEIQKLKDDKLIPEAMHFFISISAKDVISSSGYNALYELKKAGLYEVFVGIESGCKEQLKRYNKNSSVYTNKKAIEILKKLDIQTDFGFIMFDPIMDFSEISQNISFLKDINIPIDSRLIKPLRLQPFTAMETQFGSVITGKLDVDELMYPYKFQDERVSCVYKLFNNWEQEQLQNIYSIQAALRGEEIAELKKISLRNKLLSLRSIDQNVLIGIVDYIGGKINSSEYNKQLAKYKNMRDEILRDSYDMI